MFSAGQMTLEKCEWHGFCVVDQVLRHTGFVSCCAMSLLGSAPGGRAV